MNIIINGVSGRMGGILAGLITAPDSGHVLLAGADGHTPLPDAAPGADCVIDFSSPAATEAVTSWCAARHIPLVVATTGQTPADMALLHRAAEAIPLFYSANMSLGVAVLASLARQAAAMFPQADIEIVERHHNRKVDVPSGTALLLASAITEARPEAEPVIGRRENGRRRPQEIGIHSLRYGNEVGTHEIIISDGSETLTLKHEAEDRALFARGALAAAGYLVRQTAPGLYTMAGLVANS